MKKQLFTRRLRQLDCLGRLGYLCIVAQMVGPDTLYAASICHTYVIQGGTVVIVLIRMAGLPVEVRLANCSVSC